MKELKNVEDVIIENAIRKENFSFWDYADIVPMQIIKENTVLNVQIQILYTKPSIYPNTDVDWIFHVVKEKKAA